MKVKDKRLNSEKYAKLKSKVYKIYLDDVKNPDGNKIERLYNEIEKYNIPSVKEIVDDTIEFPYDKDLFDFFKRNETMKLNDFILTTSNLFGIDTELVVSKIREYTSYDYHKLLDEGKINKEYVDEISKLYLERNKEKSK